MSEYYKLTGTETKEKTTETITEEKVTKITPPTI